MKQWSKQPWPHLIHCHLSPGLQETGFTRDLMSSKFRLGNPKKDPNLVSFIIATGFPCIFFNKVLKILKMTKGLVQTLTCSECVLIMVTQTCNFNNFEVDQDFKASFNYLRLHLIFKAKITNSQVPGRVLIGQRAFLN